MSLFTRSFHLELLGMEHKSHCLFLDMRHVSPRSLLKSKNDAIPTIYSYKETPRARLSSENQR